VRKFPVRPNREFERPKQGTFLLEQGILKLEYAIFISELAIGLGGWRGGSLCHPDEND
jgi:hypothetical protein